LEERSWHHGGTAGTKPKVYGSMAFWVSESNKVMPHPISVVNDTEGFHRGFFVQQNLGFKRAEST